MQKGKPFIRYSIVAIVIVAGFIVFGTQKEIVQPMPLATMPKLSNRACCVQ